MPSWVEAGFEEYRKRMPAEQIRSYEILLVQKVKAHPINQKKPKDRLFLR